MPDIVAVTACVRYHDFLDVTLQRNRGFVRDYVVVTTESDVATREVAERAGCTVVLVDDGVLTARGAAFNKSALVRAGQRHVHERFPEAWVLLLDADIVLPAAGLDVTRLDDPSALYSLARLDYLPDDQGRFELRPEAGARYMMDFMGFFQLYFDKTKLYDEWSHSARACDAAFAERFRRYRMLELPYVAHVFHLGEGNANHFGRGEIPG